jgi:hypothetical protein
MEKGIIAPALTSCGVCLSLSCVTLGKLLDLFMPQFAHLYNGDNHSIYPWRSYHEWAFNFQLATITFYLEYS